jgi:hypothetical protein
MQIFINQNWSLWMNKTTKRVIFLSLIFGLVGGILSGALVVLLFPWHVAKSYWVRGSRFNDIRIMLGSPLSVDDCGLTIYSHNGDALAWLSADKYGSSISLRGNPRNNNKASMFMNVSGGIPQIILYNANGEPALSLLVDKDGKPMINNINLDDLVKPNNSAPLVSNPTRSTDGGGENRPEEKVAPVQATD